jgi:anti-anti-sigma factor
VPGKGGLAMEEGMNEWGPLEVERSERGSPPVIWIRLGGLLGGTQQSFEFLEGIREEAHRGSMRLVLDISEIAHLGSGGVGILAAVQISLSNHGGRLCLIGLSQRVERILRVSRLYEFLPHAKSAEEALRIVGEAAQPGESRR